MEGVAISLESMGIAQMGLGKFNEAQSSFELSLHLYPRRANMFEITQHIGEVNFAKAGECYDRSDKDGAEALFQMAIKYYIEAKNIAIKMNDEKLLILADKSLATTYKYEYMLLNKEYSTEKREFIEQFHKDIINRAAKFKFNLSSIYWDDMLVLYNQGNFGKGIEAGLKAENLFVQEIRNLQDEEAILTNKNWIKHIAIFITCCCKYAMLILNCQMMLF